MELEKQKLERRNFLKSASIASAAMAIGLSVPNMEAKAKSAEANWKWDKAPCRFCGTGCGIMIATHNDKIVAVKGDVDHPVNQGINCIKGYFTAKIMYAEDRIKKPLLRVNAKGEFDKKGKFVEVSWKRAFDEMEKQFRKAYDELGPTGVAFMTSGQNTIMEG